MRKIQIEKVVVNICVGEAGDRLTRAAKVLKELTDQEPKFSKGRFCVHCIARRLQKMYILSPYESTLISRKARDSLARKCRITDALFCFLRAVCRVR